MEAVAVSAKRRAQLEASARAQGKPVEQVVDEALAAWFEFESEDFDATVAAANQGWADFEAGRHRPAQEMLDDLRRKHGF